MNLSIKHNDYKPAFCSKNHPVEPFEINTSKGKLYVREFKLRNFSVVKQREAVAKLITDNFIEGSIDPRWKICSDSALYSDTIKLILNLNKEVFENDDGNTTFLVAKDYKRKPKAAIIMCHLQNIAVLKDSQTGYLDSLVVDKEYRGNNVAKILMEKALETGKGIFTDVFLESYNKARPFYEKLGFKELDANNHMIKYVVDIIKQHRDNIPQYSTLMSKPLDINAIRWWERLFIRL